MDPNLLPSTSTERLLAVADIIEFTPEQWNQAVWYRRGDDVNPVPEHVMRRGFDCDTVACVAGWGVALTPGMNVPHCTERWTVAGAYALGLDRDVAQKLFRSDLPLEPDELADVLRRLAKLDEGERYAPNIATVLTAEQYDAVMTTCDCPYCRRA